MAAGGSSNLTIPFVTTSQYSVGGSVWQDINGNAIKDAGENYTIATNAGEALYAVLVQTSNTYSGAPTVYASQAIAATATGYTFAGIAGSNNYDVRIVSAASAPVAGSAASGITSKLAAGYTGVSTTNAATLVTGLNTIAPSVSITNLSATLTAVGFGIEQSPVATSSTLGNQSNPGGFNGYTIPNASFNITDADGSIASITITSFPTGANYLKVGTTYYTNPTGGICPPQVTCTTWPGTLLVPFSGGNPTPAIS
ncbi:MAG: hypothetical protein ABI151_11595, partial [Chitinophagaceae bacterium]